MLADALARRFADPAALSGSEDVTLTIVDVRDASDYARLAQYLDALDTVTGVFVRRLVADRVEFELATRGGRGALEQSIAFGRVLAPLADRTGTYRLVH